MKKQIIFINALLITTALVGTQPPQTYQHPRVKELAKNLTPLDTAGKFKQPAAVKFNDWAMRYLEEGSNEYVRLDLFPGVHTYLDPQNIITITPPTREDTPEGAMPPATDFISQGYSDARRLGKLGHDEAQTLYEFAALTCIKDALEAPYVAENFKRIDTLIAPKKGFNPKINQIDLMAKRMSSWTTAAVIKRTKAELKELYNQYVTKVKAILEKAGYTQSPIDLTPIK